ncbi:MAG: hypothetical protein H6713_10555 [Myxococcales bacterium]|nr:hypothetical protein [Myxococcales bacterium]MCB9750417.1 hypothetical protein [Myxococcales bacterium]
MQSINQETQYTYLRFKLLTKGLEDECRVRLELLGIECVQEGGAHEAYGIIDASTPLIEFAASDPDVEDVQIGAPPVGF